MLTEMTIKNISFECFLDLYRTIESDETLVRHIQIRYNGIFHNVMECKIEILTDTMSDNVECRDSIIGVLNRYMW